MRFIFLIKILLAIGCIYVCLHIIFINYSVDKSLDAQITALVTLKNDPALDSAENRKRYAQNKSAINKQIDESLGEKRHANWSQLIPLILAPVSGWLLRDITTTLFKKRTN